jgi:predicted phage-related endonuclease
MNAPDRIGLTPEQKAIRSQGVGASEAWQALFDPVPLWLQKTGRAPPQDDSALLRFGHIVEPFILDEYEELQGTVLLRKPDTLRRGRMIAHLDAVAAKDGNAFAVVEAKSRGSREGFGAAGSADVPDDITVQVTQQMLLRGVDVAHIPVLFVRPPIVVYEVPFDPDLAKLIESRVERFWWHVEHDTAPSVNPDSPEAMAALRALYKGTTGERIQATRELEHWRGVFESAGEQGKRYEQTADTAKAHLLAAMGEASELVFADGRVLRRKLTKRKGYAVADTEYIDARIVNPKG